MFQLNKKLFFLSLVLGLFTLNIHAEDGAEEPAVSDEEMSTPEVPSGSKETEEMVVPAEEESEPVEAEGPAEAPEASEAPETNMDAEDF